LNQWGTGSKTMSKILEKLAVDTPITTLDLCKKVDMTESNLRCSLNDMAELGLVIKLNIPPPKGGVGRKPRTTGWIKYPPRSKS
jgi:predicted transcriptional regulator